MADNDELTRLLKEYVNENKNQKTTLSNTVKDNTDAFKDISHKLELHELKTIAGIKNLKACLKTMQIESKN